MTMWDGEIKEPVVKQYTISFCMSCQNRMHNLRGTLLDNLKRNESYPYSNFILVDYNSQDGLEGWVKDNTMEHIESGRLVYYKMVDPQPKYFNFSHARNVSFLLADGEIVNNLDIDNWIYNDKNGRQKGMCWAAYLNLLANQQSSKVIFAKGRRRMHGRCGFYKDEFVNVLGGYDEGIKTYEDYDLVIRAWNLGFTMYYWGGCFEKRIHTTVEERDSGCEGDFFEGVEKARSKSESNVRNKIFKANAGRQWGKATLIKNFTEEVTIWA
jgi:glycosyltransferase involved in cell wall biosynthesis